MYVDKCVLCDRELIENGTKILISAIVIKTILTEYKGDGDFICRSMKKCGRRVDNNLLQLRM